MGKCYAGYSLTEELPFFILLFSAGGCGGKDDIALKQELGGIDAAAPAS